MPKRNILNRGEVQQRSHPYTDTRRLAGLPGLRMLSGQDASFTDSFDMQEAGLLSFVDTVKPNNHLTCLALFSLLSTSYNSCTNT